MLRIEGNKLLSLANDREFKVGAFSSPKLAELRKSVVKSSEHFSVEETVADVQALHTLKENTGATFQVASQFNLLEMTGPDVTPEEGVGIYEYDRTQGPACAIACGAGTIFRNYFVRVGQAIGQSEEQQIDCLADLGKATENDREHHWFMKNGYALPGLDGFKRLNERLRTLTEQEREELLCEVRVGLHSHTEVTLNDAGHLVTQVYCSAMPVGYSSLAPHNWEPIARLVLDAAYEATVRIAHINKAQGGQGRLFLTLLGGGAFGNPFSWIADAIIRAKDVVGFEGLDVQIVSYGRSSDVVKDIVARVNNS